MERPPHIPVLLNEVLESASPVQGVWLDGTLGAGGYTRALLDAGADRVIGVDRDPEAGKQAEVWAAAYGDRFSFAPGTFSSLDTLAAEQGAEQLDGVVLDIGVSSMQLDQAERGFSFRHDGPLDMRMAQDGESAADLVNSLTEADLSDVLFQYGEERASRKIARAILKTRPHHTTSGLAKAIADVLPRQKPGDPHPATRSFQALRIAVNAELVELARALFAAERVLKPGGVLIVVTFHSLEDRIVKKMFARATSRGEGGNRHAPAAVLAAPSFEMIGRKAVTANAEELAANPRARSAKLRAARRTDAPAQLIDFAGLGLPGRDRKLIAEDRI
ncbi:MAG: 16S rRNA (cytosine(1402)-N(4))-methyltransferase RsmH [Pseudomonadota bacterium]